jgi:hypothetical protein
MKNKASRNYFIVIRSFVHSFIRSFVHSFIRSFVHSFIRSFVHSQTIYRRLGDVNICGKKHHENTGIYRLGSGGTRRTYIFGTHFFLFSRSISGISIIYRLATSCVPIIKNHLHLSVGLSVYRRYTYFAKTFFFSFFLDEF